MIVWVACAVFGTLLTLAALLNLWGALYEPVRQWRSRRQRERAIVLRNPNQKVRTPPAVRRARAPQRQAWRAHKRGRRRFR